MSKCGELEGMLTPASSYTAMWCANALEAKAPINNAIVINFFILFPYFEVWYCNDRVLVKSKR